MIKPSFSVKTKSSLTFLQNETYYEENNIQAL